MTEGKVKYVDFFLKHNLYCYINRYFLRGIGHIFYWRILNTQFWMAKYFLLDRGDWFTLVRCLVVFHVRQTRKSSKNFGKRKTVHTQKYERESER